MNRAGGSAAAAVKEDNTAAATAQIPRRMTQLL
jgi:hypothetical protein